MAWSQLTGQALFAALPTPALVFDADGIVVAANQGAAQLFERTLPFPPLSVTELLAQPERTRLDPLNWMRKWADAPDAPELDYVYLTCRTARGEEKQLSVRVARLGDGAGAATEYLVTMHDISLWEKRLHDERDAHRLAARVLAMSADAVIVVDENFNVTYANRSAHSLLKYPQGSLLNTPLAALIPQQYRGRHDGFMAQFAKEVNPSRLMSERSPVVALARDGQEIPVEASIARMTVKGRPVFSAHLRAKTASGEARVKTHA